jgi:hypothetical protein
LAQNVIRRWYAQLPEIVSTADGLSENAEASVASFKEGNLAIIGQHLSTYVAMSLRAGGFVFVFSVADSNTLVQVLVAKEVHG